MAAKAPYRIETAKEVKQAKAKLILWLSFALVKYELLRKIIKRFKEEGIFESEEYRLYIKAWLSYLDQKEFSEKLEKQMLEEIKRYLETRDRKILDYIVEVIWNETDTEAWIVLIPK